MTAIDIETRLSDAEDTLKRKADVEIVETYSHTVAGEQFSVRHSLGKKPLAVAALAYVANGAPYAAEDDRRVWNERIVALRCPISDAKLTLVIIA
jgi:hypothetical protein